MPQTNDIEKKSSFFQNISIRKKAFFGLGAKNQVWEICYVWGTDIDIINNFYSVFHIYKIKWHTSPNKKR